MGLGETVRSDIRDLTDGGGLKMITIIHLVCYAVLLTTTCVIAIKWKNEAVGRARAEAISEAEHRVQADAQKRLDDREANFKKDIDALKQENAQIISQKQAVEVVTKYIPQAAPTEVKREDIKPEVAAKLPDSPGYTIRTEAQEIALGKAVNQCQQDKDGLSKCIADKADVQAKFESAKRESDGGAPPQKKQGFFRRLGAGLAHNVCGGLGTAAGAEAAKKADPKTGVIVGAGTWVGCELFARMRH